MNHFVQVPGQARNLLFFPDGAAALVSPPTIFPGDLLPLPNPFTRFFP